MSPKVNVASSMYELGRASSPSPSEAGASFFINAFMERPICLVLLLISMILQSTTSPIAKTSEGLLILSLEICEM